jgi:arginine decarboxylase
VDAKKVKPRMLTLTQSTYDGVLYNTETIKNMLDGYVENLHFDEAWLPHAAFHPFYGTYHAMGKKRARPQRRHGLCHAVHPQAAGRHQPGQPCAGAGLTDSQAGPGTVQRGVPDAHLDLAAVQHHCQLRCGRRHDGAAWWHGPGRGEHCRGAGLPPRHAQGGRGVRRRLVVQGLGPDKLVEEGIGRATDWIIKGESKNARKANWHGFGKMATGFNMLDPIKSTIVTPGMDLNGKFAKTGIPASIVTKFLAEHGVVVEKTGCTASSSCSPSASPRAAGTPC